MNDTLPPLPADPSQGAPVARPDGAAPLRLGGLSPLFPPTAVADPGRLRLGGLSPLFGRG